MGELADGAIGTYHEKSLHSSLKLWYAHEGDLLEASVGDYLVDILRGDAVIEIQTGNFHAIKRKLEALMEERSVRVVYPIARERWILKISPSGKIISRRKSPKRGKITALFEELIRIPHLIAHPNFSLEALFVKDEELRCDDGLGSWRRKRVSIHDRRLIEVSNSEVFETPADFERVLPQELPQQFTTTELATGLNVSKPVARKIAYCLRRMGVLEVRGKQGRNLVYSRTNR